LRHSGREGEELAAEIICLIATLANSIGKPDRLIGKTSLIDPLVAVDSFYRRVTSMYR
jgi:hypothetical protein